MMNTNQKNIIIPVYQSEKAVAGLVEKIQRQTSIAYITPIFNKFPNVESLNCKAIAKVIDDLVVASENDSDLYPTKSVLVSTNWNKNDDVFDKGETWAARHTPSHKPTNIEHDEHKLCGHITNTWSIDAEGKIIADNTNVDELPSLYHIVNGAVIYKSWQDKELIDRTEKLIAEIEKGEKYVSMECLFTDFDYAIADINDESRTIEKVIARDDGSSWLTKHLRAYGGLGVYENKRVGRLLRNITFCGKGYVEKPANSASIIFANWNIPDIIKEDEQNTENKSDGVKLVTEITKGEDMTPEELKELTEKLQSTEANLNSANSKISELENAVKAKTEANTELEGRISALETKVTELTSANDELSKAKTDLEAELDKIRANELKTNRISQLVDGGIDKEVATSKVELFIALNDEQFNAVAEELIAAAKAVKSAKKSDKDEDEEDDDEKDKAGEQSAESNQDVDTESTNQDIDLAAGSEIEDKEIDEIRDELVKAISGVLGVSEKK
jgi:uncharacterized coiled-coil protein SlyX